MPQPQRFRDALLGFSLSVIRVASQPQYPRQLGSPRNPVINFISIQYGRRHLLTSRLQRQFDMLLRKRILSEVTEGAAHYAVTARFNHWIRRCLSGGGEHLA